MKGGKRTGYYVSKSQPNIKNLDPKIRSAVADLEKLERLMNAALQKEKNRHEL